MNAEQHREAAIACLGCSDDAFTSNDDRRAAYWLTQAQVHATLATNLPPDAAALSAAQGRIAELEATARYLTRVVSARTDRIAYLEAQLAQVQAERDTAHALAHQH